ncbi:divergent polysaccharide deacetylase family protein [Sulfitobacter sp. LCG007]
MGFLKGAINGGVLGLAVAAVASVIAEGPRPPEVDERLPDRVSLDAATPRTPAGPGSGAGRDRVPVQGDRAPKTPEPDGEQMASLRTIDMLPSQPPVTGAADALPHADPVAIVPPLRAPSPERPVTSVPTGTTEGMPAGPAAGEATFEAPVVVVPEVETWTPQGPGAAKETAPPGAAVLPTVPDRAAAEDFTALVPAPQDDPGRPAATQAIPSARAPISAPDGPPDGLDRPDASAGRSPRGNGEASFAGTLKDRANGVLVNRLPNVGDDSGPRSSGNESAADGLLPLRQFREPFDNPEAKPLMSIVLMDDGTAATDDRIGVEALGSFPYPVSFAVDATLPDAEARMRAYRERGFEVLAMLDLPENATARDAEVSVAAALATVPEAVALLEGPGVGFQSDRAASDQVTAILRDSGQGLVTQNRGLNTAQKLAVKQGVPAVSVFRDFDSAGQTPVVIRRFLDQAAFRAGQEGAVVMLGRLRPDTISALLLWGLQDRAEKVALAPISAVLVPQD